MVTYFHCQLDTLEAMKCSPLLFHSSVPPPDTLSARFGRANSVPLRHWYVLQSSFFKRFLG